MSALFVSNAFTPALAGETAEEIKEQIRTMRQAAAELRPTDPLLADKLDAIAARKKEKLSKEGN